MQGLLLLTTTTQWRYGREYTSLRTSTVSPPHSCLLLVLDVSENTSNTNTERHLYIGWQLVLTGILQPPPKPHIRSVEWRGLHDTPDKRVIYIHTYTPSHSRSYVQGIERSQTPLPTHILIVSPCVYVVWYGRALRQRSRVLVLLLVGSMDPTVCLLCSTYICRTQQTHTYIEFDVDPLVSCFFSG